MVLLGYIWDVSANVSRELLTDYASMGRFRACFLLNPDMLNT